MADLTSRATIPRTASPFRNRLNGALSLGATSARTLLRSFTRCSWPSASWLRGTPFRRLPPQRLAWAAAGGTRRVHPPYRGRSSASRYSSHNHAISRYFVSTMPTLAHPSWVLRTLIRKRSQVESWIAHDRPRDAGPRSSRDGFITSGVIRCWGRSRPRLSPPAHPPRPTAQGIHPAQAQGYHLSRRSPPMRPRRGRASAVPRRSRRAPDRRCQVTRGALRAARRSPPRPAGRS